MTAPRHLRSLIVAVVAILAVTACGGREKTDAPLPSGILDFTIFAVRGDNELIRFDPNSPQQVVRVGQVSPLRHGDRIVAIDFSRSESDRRLFGLSNAGELLVIDTETANAEVARRDGTLRLDVNHPQVALSFDPTFPFSLRMLSGAETHQSSAPPFENGAQAQARLGYAQADVVAIAHTNPSRGSADTTLFAIAGPPYRLLRIGSSPNVEGDCDSDRPYPEGNPDCGAAQVIAPLQLGDGVIVSYEISQRSSVNEHYLLVKTGESYAILRLNPATGVLSDISGALPAGDYHGFSTLTPASGNRRGFALLRTLDDVNAIVGITVDLFDSRVTLETETVIDGLPSGERLVGLDRRTADINLPNDIALYAISASGRLFALRGDPNDVERSEAIEITLVDSRGSSEPPLTIGSERVAIDFNPRRNHLRLVTDQGRNFRINVDTGAVIPSKPLRSISVNPPLPVASGFLAPALGQQRSVLYVIDGQDSSLARSDRPDDGLLQSVGPLFADGSLDLNRPQSFDIAGRRGTLVFAALIQPGEMRSQLYFIDLDTGAATLIGPIGQAGDAPVDAIAIQVQAEQLMLF